VGLGRSLQGHPRRVEGVEMRARSNWLNDRQTVETEIDLEKVVESVDFLKAFLLSSVLCSVQAKDTITEMAGTVSLVHV